MRISSIPAAPAATRRIPSTSRPARLSSPPRRAPGWPSTWGARCRRPRAAPKCWKRSAPALRSRRSRPGRRSTTSAETMVGELVKGEIKEYLIHPSHFGLELYDRRAIQVNTVEESKEMILAVLGNQPGPAHNIAAMNAGAAIYVSGLCKTFKEGIERARHVIQSGEAKRKLDEFEIGRAHV